MTTTNKTMEHYKELDRAINLHNEFARVAAPLFDFALEQSKQFIGKKISTLKGLTAKYSEAIKLDRSTIQVNPLPGKRWANLHRFLISTDGTRLTLEISLCFSVGESGCIYHQNSYTIGTMAGDTLISVEPKNYVDTTVWDYETELKKIKAYKEVIRQADEIKNTINVYSDVYKYID